MTTTLVVTSDGDTLRHSIVHMTTTLVVTSDGDTLRLRPYDYHFVGYLRW